MPVMRNVHLISVQSWTCLLKGKDRKLSTSGKVGNPDRASGSDPSLKM